MENIMDNNRQQLLPIAESIESIRNDEAIYQALKEEPVKRPILNHMSTLKESMVPQELNDEASELGNSKAPPEDKKPKKSGNKGIKEFVPKGFMSGLNKVHHNRTFC